MAVLSTGSCCRKLLPVVRCTRCGKVLKAWWNEYEEDEWLWVETCDCIILPAKD